MDIEPQIVEEVEKNAGERNIEEPQQGENAREEENGLTEEQRKFIEEVRIGDETIFTIPPEMQYS